MATTDIRENGRYHGFCAAKDLLKGALTQSPDSPNLVMLDPEFVRGALQALAEATVMMRLSQAEAIKEFADAVTLAEPLRREMRKLRRKKSRPKLRLVREDPTF